MSERRSEHIQSIFYILRMSLWISFGYVYTARIGKGEEIVNSPEKRTDRRNIQPFTFQRSSRKLPLHIHLQKKG